MPVGNPFEFVLEQGINNLKGENAALRERVRHLETQILTLNSIIESGRKQLLRTEEYLREVTKEANT